jgi:GTP 3',8-cyclase
VSAVVDRLGRPLEDLRVSVTDRCNFRCPYCMPRDRFGADFAFVERDELLTFEEITRIVRAAATLGVRKVRLTGGEPLLRRDLPALVGMLRAVPSIDDLALTTNGVMLAAHASALAEAGLDRVTVSLDALDQETFAAMSDTTIPVERVIEGLAAARDAGLVPVKTNTVVRRGMNEDRIVEVAAFAREHGYTARFIEFMDVGTTNGWRRDEVVPADEILAAIGAAFPLEPIDEPSSAPATRFRYRDGAGEVGVVASVTGPFCRTCVRARLSPVGEVFTCLFAARGHDLRGLLRSGASDDDLEDALTEIWGGRADRYSELRSEATATLPRVEMSYIGG